jgi:hypothetical protein
MRITAAITVASVFFAIGGGCSRPWNASTADLAPPRSPHYGPTRYSIPFDPSSRNPDGDPASPINPTSPASESQPPPAWPGARKVKTITIPGPAAYQ